MIHSTVNVMENVKYLPYSEGLFKTINQDSLKPKKVSPCDQGACCLS